ncbi:MAG: MFS transporter, partial [Eubacteriales bacterium]
PGTTLFSILAFAGDVGCSFGPWLAGNISDLVRVDASFLSLSEKLSLTPDQLGLRAGILVSAIFPLIMFIAIAAVMRNKTSKNEISLN